MPSAGSVTTPDGGTAEYYEIAMRQFEQQILPEGLPKTTVWGYGAVGHDDTFNAPSYTIEAKADVPTRVKWVNELTDENGEYVPHLLPIDQTVHWANPGMGDSGRDMEGTDPKPYTGPVPIVTHVHGAHTHEESDGYPEAWYLPAAKNIPEGFATVGSAYAANAAKAEKRQGVAWEPGSATFEYPNDQRATTLWYHDHALGMTRANVYAGPAGFYMIRGGASDDVRTKDGSVTVLPGSPGDTAGERAYEIPVVIQDRSFNPDGSLAYPDNRAFFEGVAKEELQIPFIPESACDGPSDISPIWNPEFFGETLVTNGRAWPYHEVEPRRYRLRFLNGCQARFLVLEFADQRSFWQIGSDGGFLPEAAPLKQLLIAPAERADVIVDFAGLAEGQTLLLRNVGPDEPYGGPGFTPANPETTGQVMEFRAVGLAEADPTTPPDAMVFPKIDMPAKEVLTRKVSLNELESETVRVITGDDGSIKLACGDEEAEAFAPRQALLGIVGGDEGVPLRWSDKVTETPKAGTAEIWEIHNYTADAHPIHVHQVMFSLVDRIEKDGDKKHAPESWERGLKDTVIAYPEQVTRIRIPFSIAGRFVWHCHILEHEDNEMMRPYEVNE
jgi:bilirubin oxidase